MRNGTDWAAVKLAYVNSTKPQREIAADFGIKAAGLMARAAKEGWDAERKQRQAQLSSVVNEILFEDKVKELSEYNASDLDAAKKIRAKALTMLDAAADPAEVKSIASALETASKVARLALGAATENSSVTTKALPSSVDDFV